MLFKVILGCGLWAFSTEFYLLTRVVVSGCDPFVLPAVCRSHVAPQVSRTLPPAGARRVVLTVAPGAADITPQALWPTPPTLPPTHHTPATLIPAPGPLHLLLPLPGMLLLVWLFFITLALVHSHCLRSLPGPPGSVALPSQKLRPRAQGLPGGMRAGLQWMWLGHRAQGWGERRARELSERRWKKASNTMPVRLCEPRPPVCWVQCPKSA